MAANSMTDDELTMFLKTIFNIDVSKKDVVDCKPEFVQKIYTFFLKDFGASLDKINQVPISAPTTINQYPDMFKSTCFIVGLAKTIHYYLVLIYKTTSDFGINDLILPNRMRTKKFFILFLEFYDHVYQNLDTYDEIENEASLEKQKFEKLRSRIRSLEQKIVERQMKNAEYEICLQKEMEQFAEIEKEMEIVQANKNKLKEYLENTKAEIKSVISKIKQTELEILEDKERIQILETQVMQDDEIAKIEEQNAALDALKNSNAELKKQRSDLNRTLQNIKDKEKLITDALIPLLEEIEQGNAKNKEADSVVIGLQKMTLSLMEKLEDQSRIQQQLLENIKLLQEKQAVLHKAKEVKKNGLLEEIKQLRLNASELLSSNEKQSLAERELIAEIKKIKEEYRIKEEKLRYFLATVRQTFTTLVDNVKNIDVKKLRSKKK